jgi:hypothetical protein
MSGQSTFDRNTVMLIKNFLAPLCLVAHNGDLYDFPLLRAELKKVEITLLSKTLCAIFYVGIKEIFKRTNLGSPSSYSLINPIRNNPMVRKLIA